MQKDTILNGVHIGEHGFDPDKVIDEIKERCIQNGFNYVSLWPRGSAFDQEYFILWAKFMAENHLYFSLNYMVQFPPKGMESRINADTVRRVKEVAGDYFLGDLLGEPGSTYACKLPGYYMSDIKDFCTPGLKPEGPVQIDPASYRKMYRNFRLGQYEDMAQAHEGYVKTVAKYADINKRNGMPNVLSVDYTAFAKYNVEPV